MRFVDQFSTDRCQLVLGISNQNICRALVYQVVKNKALYSESIPISLGTTSAD